MSLSFCIVGLCHQPLPEPLHAAGRCVHGAQTPMAFCPPCRSPGSLGIGRSLQGPCCQGSLSPSLAASSVQPCFLFIPLRSSDCLLVSTRKLGNHYKWFDMTLRSPYFCVLFSQGTKELPMSLIRKITWKNSIGT